MEGWMVHLFELLKHEEITIIFYDDVRVKSKQENFGARLSRVRKYVGGLKTQNKTNDIV